MKVAQIPDAGLAAGDGSPDCFYDYGFTHGRSSEWLVAQAGLAAIKIERPSVLDDDGISMTDGVTAVAVFCRLLPVSRTDDQL